MPLNLKLRSALISFITLPSAAMSILIITAISGKNPANFRIFEWSVIISCALLTWGLSYGADLITGMIVGLFSVLLIEFIVEKLFLIHNYEIFILVISGLLIGTLISRHSAWIIAALIALPIILMTGLPFYSIVIFIFLVFLGYSIRLISQRLYFEIKRPLRDLRSKWIPLVGFISAYISIVIIYALIYNLINLTFNSAFVSKEIEKTDLNLLFFLYFSIMILASGEVSLVTPVNDLTRVLIASEVLVGVFLIVIYFQFLFTSISRTSAEKGA